MSPHVRHFKLEDAAPYRRLAQFTPVAEAHAIAAPARAPRTILGLTNRRPLFVMGHGVAVRPHHQQSDAA